MSLDSAGIVISQLSSQAAGVFKGEYFQKVYSLVKLGFFLISSHGKSAWVRELFITRQFL